MGNNANNCGILHRVFLVILYYISIKDIYYGVRLTCAVSRVGPYLNVNIFKHTLNFIYLNTVFK